MTSGQPLKPLPRNRDRDGDQGREQEQAREQGREPTLTIAQVSERTGLSHDTLRYYEKAGLIERVGRSTGNQRRYQAADLAWLEFLLRLRETGMSIADMQRFAALRAAGNVSVADRLAMLRAHRAELADRIRTLRRNATVLDHKIDHYEQLLLDEVGHERQGSDELT
ncbi:MULTISPECIES: MerR family transcriptional regulator [unclassified Streptomyces]|uniref:MerR family transcriptional regulator n=1 Tax=unclassified Streptomyces TaxID=2593676 RepID=UPI0033201FEE